MGFGTHNNIVDSLMVYDILPQTISLYDIQIDFSILIIFLLSIFHRLIRVFYVV